MIDSKELQAACFGFKDETTAFLDRLIRFESLAGYEGPAMEWLYDRFLPLADICEKVTVAEEIVSDPEYSSTVHGLPYAGRPNLRVVLKGDGSGKSVIFNAHVDVVPATSQQDRPFDPVIEDGAMYGRGACDDKGQIAALFALFKAFKQLGIRPKGDIILHLVIEEEPGGNGTLAFIRSGETADCCINLEPTMNKLCTSIRGSVWYNATCYGRAGHAGTADTTVSALKMAMAAIGIIEDYHEELLAETIDIDPLFSKYKNPMPVCFGELHAGNWPTITPEKAVFRGMFGFLTTPKETVMREIEERVKNRGPEWLKDNFEIEYPYRHDASRIDPELPFVKTLAKSYESMGVASEIDGVVSSMDGWLYNNLLGIPSLATGCGSLWDAHTIREHVVLDDVMNLAATLAVFSRDWCGVA